MKLSTDPVGTTSGAGAAEEWAEQGIEPVSEADRLRPDQPDAGLIPTFPLRCGTGIVLR